MGIFPQGVSVASPARPRPIKRSHTEQILNRLTWVRQLPQWRTLALFHFGFLAEYY
jgi:hypothetical protein